MTRPLVFLLLLTALATAQPRHTRHFEQLGADAPGYNGQVLKAVDVVQAHAPDGGGYFMDVKAVPPESPIGYPLSLFGQALLAPPRPTSYCSGSSYAVFIEALNLIFPSPRELSAERLEALRMQEPDGSRREDGVKAWGWWNADGFGSHFALVQYLGMGEEIAPDDARPGDFLNITWKSGNGHSVVFLGYVGDDVAYFSSQRASSGLSDQRAAREKIAEVKFVRLTRPDNLFCFDPRAQVRTQIKGDKL